MVEIETRLAQLWMHVLIGSTHWEDLFNTVCWFFFFFFLLAASNR
jgi:hypothetical protein